MSHIPQSGDATRSSAGDTASPTGDAVSPEGDLLASSNFGICDTTHSLQNTVRRSRSSGVNSGDFSRRLVFANDELSFECF